MTTAILDDQTVKIRARREIALRTAHDFGGPNQLGIFFHALSPQEKWIPKPSYLLHEHTQDLPGTVGAFCDLFHRVDEASSAYKTYSVQMKRSLVDHAVSVESVPNTPPVIANEILAAISPTLTAWPSIDACLARLTDNVTPLLRLHSDDIAPDLGLSPEYQKNLSAFLNANAANPKIAVVVAEYISTYTQTVSGNQAPVDALQGLKNQILQGIVNAHRLSKVIIANTIGRAFDNVFSSLFKPMTKPRDTWENRLLFANRQIDDAVGDALIEPLRNDICMDPDRKMLTLAPYERETFLNSARSLKEELDPDAYLALTSSQHGMTLKPGRTFRLFNDMASSLPRYQMALGMASVAFYQGRLLQSQIVGNRIGWKPFAKITG